MSDVCTECGSSFEERLEEERSLDQLREDLADARTWARHGYEIGQRSLLWSDFGVAPKWLTEGWPIHFKTDRVFCNDCDQQIVGCGAEHPEYGFNCDIPSANHGGLHFDRDGGGWWTHTHGQVPDPAGAIGAFEACGDVVRELRRRLDPAAVAVLEQVLNEHHITVFPKESPS